MFSRLAAGAGRLAPSFRLRMPQRKFSSAAELAALEETYATPLRYLHWVIAGGVLACFGLVKSAQWTPKEDMKTKMKLMNLHKSFGVALAVLVPIRVAVRLTTKIPATLPGPIWEQYAGKLSHLATYGAMIFMPASGVAMGYFGGKGLPFFGTTIPGAPKGSTRPDIAGPAFKAHKLVGQVFEYGLVPVHVGAVGFHAIKGQNILRRVNPFAKPKAP